MGWQHWIVNPGPVGRASYFLSEADLLPRGWQLSFCVHIGFGHQGHMHLSNPLPVRGGGSDDDGGWRRPRPSKQKPQTVLTFKTAYHHHHHHHHP